MNFFQAALNILDVYFGRAFHSLMIAYNAETGKSLLARRALCERKIADLSVELRSELAYRAQLDGALAEMASSISESQLALAVRSK